MAPEHEGGAAATEFLDWRGTPVRIGSRVVYPVRHSSRVWMVEAEVLEVLPHGPDEERMQLTERRPDWAALYYQPWRRFNLVVRRIRTSRGPFAPVRRRRQHLTMTIAVTVMEPADIGMA